MTTRTRTQSPTSTSGETQEDLAPALLEPEGAPRAPGPQPAPGEAPSEVLARVLRQVEQARAASTAEWERQSLAGHINEALDALGRAGGTREAADVFHRLLEEGSLAGLKDSRGRACREAAVEGLLALGFPYALEVCPEDMEALRPRSLLPGRWADALGVGVLLLGGLLVQALLDRPGLGQPGESTPEALWGLGLFCMVGALLAAQGSPLRRLSLGLGTLLAGLQVLLGLSAEYGGVWSGLAGLVAVGLLARHEGPGASTSPDVRPMD